MQILGIHHLSIIAGDIEKSLEFYKEGGRLKLNRVERSETKDSYFLQVPNDGELELIDLKGKQVTDPVSARCVRFHHIAFRVDDPRKYSDDFMPIAEKWQFYLNHGDPFGHYACGPIDPDGLTTEWLSAYEPIPNNYYMTKDFSSGAGFHHFCFYIDKIKESFNFYNKVLGLQLVREMFGVVIDSCPSDAYYFQIPGSGELEMIDHRGAQMRIDIEPNHTGATKCAFSVDNAQEYCDYLRIKGFQSIMTDKNICQVKDPNGIMLEFIS